jgi:hypothetical protein
MRLMQHMVYLELPSVPGLRKRGRLLDNDGRVGATVAKLSTRPFKSCVRALKACIEVLKSTPGPTQS